MLFHQTSKLPLAPVVRLAWSKRISMISPAVRPVMVWLISAFAEVVVGPLPPPPPFTITPPPPPPPLADSPMSLTLSIDAPAWSSVPVPRKRSTLLPVIAVSAISSVTITVLVSLIVAISSLFQ